MSVPAQLAACVGDWRGSNRLHDPHSGRPEDSPGTATVAAVLGGRFVRIDYTWAYQGRPQEGSLLVDGDPSASALTAHWIDSWHMSHAGMACAGAALPDGSISVRGSYAAPPGPDWGWRIDIAFGDGAALRIVMFNITPDGKEEIAVEAKYHRGGAA